MEDMAATILYGYDGDHVDTDDSVESSLDDYETVEKKPRLDHHEMEKHDEDDDDDDDDDDDLSSVDSLDDYDFSSWGNNLSVKEKKKIRREINEKFKAWSATIKKEDTFAVMDTTGASILKMDGHQLLQTNPTLLHDLVCMLRSCRRRMTIYTFTHPDEHALQLDGGTTAYEISELSDSDLQSYSTKVRNVIQQYNDTVINEHSDSVLEFASLTRVVCISINHFYITFTARQNGNGQIGTYQAALCDDFNDEVYLVLLRHVEADKVLAILAISGAEDALKKMFGYNWNH